MLLFLEYLQNIVKVFAKYCKSIISTSNFHF
jgi:hypothetical protein